MELFLDFPLSTLFVLAVAGWVTLRVARRRRPTGGDGRTRAGRGSCPQCGAAVPPVAQFCRNCGQPVMR